MAVAEENEKDEGKAEAPKKSSKKLFIIIGVVVVILVAVGAVFMLGGGKKHAEEEGAELAEEQRKEVHLQTAKLPTFICNLSESSSFIKVTLLLEYDPSVLTKVAGGHGKGGGGGFGGGGVSAESKGDAGGLPPMIAEREPMIKDAIIRVLSAKTAKEVLSAEGKEKLKEELIEAVNEAIGLDEAPVVNIYFEEFIIQ